MKDERKEKKLSEEKETAAPVSKAAEAGDPARQALKGLSREQLEEKTLQEEERRSGEYKDDLQRKQAELENYRKRMVREQTRIIEQANRRLIEQLLPVIDNLEKALQSSQASGDQLTQGVRMVYDQLMDLLKKEGLEEINPLGHPFDPEVCEAVMAVVSDNHEDETVVEVHQKGYMYKGNLLRPARATVSKCD
jgi:molecular chaperone GrpE